MMLDLREPLQTRLVEILARRTTLGVAYLGLHVIERRRADDREAD